MTVAPQINAPGRLAGDLTKLKGGVHLSVGRITGYSKCLPLPPNQPLTPSMYSIGNVDCHSDEKWPRIKRLRSRDAFCLPTLMIFSHIFLDFRLWAVKICLKMRVARGDRGSQPPPPQLAPSTKFRGKNGAV